MRTNYRMNSGVRFQMLSDDQLEELFWGVLHVLEYTGLDVHHEEARDILKKAGAWVDGIRVRLPRTGSAAVRAGLREGDRIVAIDGRGNLWEGDYAALQTAIRGHQSGEAIRLSVQRGMELLDVSVSRP